MQPDIRLRLEDGTHLFDHLENGIGQVVAHILAAASHPSQADELPESGRDPLIAPEPHHRIVGRVCVHPETLQNLFPELPFHAGSTRMFPVRVQVLIHAAEAHSGTGIVFIAHDEHVVQPECLHGFPESRCRFPGNAVQNHRHAAQLFAARGVHRLRRKVPAKPGVVCRDGTWHQCRGHHGA